MEDLQRLGAMVEN